MTTTPSPEALIEIVRKNGPVVIDAYGEGLAWRPLDYGTWTPLATPPHLPPDELPNNRVDRFQILRKVERDLLGKTFPDWMQGVTIGGYREQGWSAFYQGQQVASGEWGEYLYRSSLPEPVGDEALVERVECDRLRSALMTLLGSAESAAWHCNTGAMDEAIKIARAAIQAIPAPATDAGQSADSLVEALREIECRDWIENVLDPQWAAMRANQALASLPKSPSAGEEA